MPNPITPIMQGMKITLGHLFKKPVTLMYPEERPKVAERYRGLHALKVSHSKAKCVACYLCPTVCPAKCARFRPKISPASGWLHGRS